MTRQISKLAALLGLMTLLSNGFALNASAAVRTSAVLPSFCTRVDSVATTVTSAVTKAQTAYAANWSQREETISSRETSADKKLADVRKSEDTARNAQYAKLDELAKTDAQKAAVAAFKETISAAITARQMAVDKAIATFRSGLTTAVSARKTGMDASVATFVSSVNAAVSTAKSSCSEGTDGTQVRTEFVNALKAAQVQLGNDRQSFETAKAIDDLLAARRSAIQSAIDAFTATAEQARATLKAAISS